MKLQCFNIFLNTDKTRDVRKYLSFLALSALVKLEKHILLEMIGKNKHQLK